MSGFRPASMQVVDGNRGIRDGDAVLSRLP